MSNIIDSIQLSGITYQIEGDVTVDAALDSGSTNPVENKAIYNKFDEVEQVTAAALNELNDAISGKVDTSTYNTYTAATDTALNGKQPTLVSGTNIKTINNQSILGSGNIDIQGGGKAIEAGRGIAITTGETADTVSFDLPIYKTVSGTAFSLVLNTSSEPSANTFKTKYNTYINCINPYVAVNSGTRNLIMGEACSAMSYTSESFVGGYNSKIGDMRTFAFGGRSEALSVGAVAFGYDGQAFKPQVSKGYGSFACGGGTSANTYYSFATGYHTFTTSRSEFASGQYNNSVSASTTFGDSGNTLFSVGNGTADNARHNAFEIRQNGDIYLTLDGQDVKLQDHLGGSSITVDDELSSTSENPVQNKVIYNKIDEVEQVTAAALNELDETVSGKQDELISGTNIKTINNESILGSGNIVIGGGGSKTVDPSLDPTSTNPVENKAIYNKIDEVEQVTAAGLNAVNDKFDGLRLKKLTQTEYNNLQTKDPSTLYVIVD